MTIECSTCRGQGSIATPTGHTSLPGDGPETPRERRKRLRAKPMAGARVYGIKTPVTLRLTLAGGAQPWYEISYSQGRFFLLGDSSVHDLVQRIIAGDVLLRDEASTTSRRRRGKAQ